MHSMTDMQNQNKNLSLNTEAIEFHQIIFQKSRLNDENS